MKIVSFGWTWPALFAPGGLVKLCTRRDWMEKYAESFKEGEYVQAWDRGARVKGRKLGVVQLAEEPYLDPLINMPDSDYEAEGFAFLHEHPELLPKSMPYDVSPEGFEAWRRSGDIMYTIRFKEIEEVTPYARIELEKMGDICVTGILSL